MSGRKHYHIAMKIIVYLMPLFIVLSCVREKRFLIVEDDRYFEPAYRIEKIVGTDTFYYLGKRYYVYNYSSNKDVFDSLSIGLLCKAISDSLPLARCDFNFQKMPYYSAKYEPGQSLTADWTKNITTYLWYMEEKDVIKSRWGEAPYIRKKIEFNCDLNQNYPKGKE
jgi:hypothetical protein